MKKLSNYSLKVKNTFHIDGIAENYYVPEGEKELSELFNTIKSEKFYILSGGSNILLDDSKKLKHVIYMSEIDKNFKHISDGCFYIGASLRIQKVINNLNNLGYGGIEEMYSLPAMFGGIIYMNAGIGKKNNSLFTISDFINKVKTFNIQTSQIEWIDKENCMFSHRCSIFQNNKYVILGAECNFIKQSIEKSKERIKIRLEKTRRNQEMGKGTFGTCFAEANPKLLKIISILTHRKGKIRFASNNANWFVNDGNGTFSDCMILIKRCELIHKIFHKNIKREVRIWE